MLDGGGGLIAFYTNRARSNDLYIMDDDGMNGSQVVIGPSCDGSGDILVMDARGGTIANLTRGEGENANPTWSRDGTRIVFQSTRDGSSNLYAMDPDGRNLQALTTGSDHSAAPVWQP